MITRPGSASKHLLLLEQKILFGCCIFTIIILALLIHRYFNSECEPDETICFSILTIWKNKPKYLIDTPACKIYSIDPFYSDVLPYLRVKKRRECPPPIVANVNGTLRYVVPEQNVSCCLRTIERLSQLPTKYNSVADRRIRISKKCENIPNDTQGIPIPSEFVQVDCTSHVKGNSTAKMEKLYFSLPFPPERHSAETSAKVDHWQRLAAASRTSKFQLPPSILLIGIDSISRLHFHRSLPQTRTVLYDNDFVEMRGYTKMGHNTFPNAMAFLGGMVPRFWSCWGDRSKKIDGCPFVWKNFSRSHYVTAFLEDSPGIGIFNYFKVGFVEQPTDYYLRPFTLAYAGTQPGRGYHGCVGSLSETEMMAKFTREFLTLMTSRGVPYFLMSWYSSPAHDDFNNLQPLDTVFRDLLQHALTSADPNTLLVFFSDHGHLFNPFRGTMMGYFEESLPFLFMRVPARMKAEHPDWYANLRENSGKLTTPLDLHGALKDVLDLVSNADGEQRKSYTDGRSRKPPWGDGVSYSLFGEIPKNRTCSSARIPGEYCRCGVNPTKGVKTKSMFHLGVAMAGKINELIHKEIAANICVPLKFKEFKYIREISQTEEVGSVVRPEMSNGTRYKDHVVSILATPAKSNFEGIVRIFRNRSAAIVSDISRTNSYEGQADCMRDYGLKGYCICKNYWDKVMEEKRRVEKRKKMLKQKMREKALLKAIRTGKG